MSGTVTGTARGDRRAFELTAFLVMTAFAVGAAVQTVFVFRPVRLEEQEQTAVAIDLGLRLGVNLITVVLTVVLARILRLSERPGPAAARWTLAAAVLVGGGRFALQCLVGLYPEPTLRDAAVEIGSTAMVAVLSVAVARVQLHARRRIREQASDAAEQRVRASAALAGLAAEEARVRREVADDLHGTLQGRIVLVQAQLDALLRAHDEGRDDAALRAGLGRVRDELDRIRETEIRAVSHRLHPAGVSIGLAHALRLLVRTIPPEIEVETVIDPAAETPAPAPGPDALVRRVALLRAAEEAVTNALRHGRASRLRVALHRSASGVLRVTVDNDGSRMPVRVAPSGVAVVAERLEALGGSVALEPSPLGGVRLIATLPDAPASVDSSA
jgi:signal transduction histidine kinase